ncbi:MAG: YhdP family protein [Nitrosomonadaceae bacterium]
MKRSGFLFRFLTSCLLVLAVCVSLLLLTLRYWLLPDIDHYRKDIAFAITQAAGQRVTIGSISANWDGLHPNLMLRKVQVHDKEGSPVLLLNRIESTFSWLSLLHGELDFREIKIEQPNLTVYRDAKGVLHVAGITLSREQTANQIGFLAWLLHQRHVDVVDANIIWQDEKRGAPLLELRAVNLHLENRGNRHRFGVRATPPAELASPLDVRGDFTGELLSTSEQWHGQLFVKLNYVDIAAWRSWISLAKTIEINRGTGALQMWINLDRGGIKRLTADLRLENVKTRLTNELPELDLASLQGRVGWKKIKNSTGKGFELFARQLGAAIRGERVLPPADFLLQAVWAHDGKQSGGKLSVNGLDLGILVDLMDYFPLDGPSRERLTRLSPRGEIRDMRAKWDGAWSAPVHLRVKGRFINIGMNRFEAVPAFRGVSGYIDISEKGGTLNFNSQKVSLDLPEVFRKVLLLDTFTGQASWKPLKNQDSIEIKFSNISFANSHVSGGIHGSYRTERDGLGEIDLVGHLMHADARYVGHYMPKKINKLTHEWIEKSIVAGELSDVRLRLKGRLAAFPFNNNERGVFQISMKASGGVLDYIPGWPRIEDISANLLFQGSRMEINVSQANLFDARLSKVNVQIADMMASDMRLQIKGVATGATKQFMKFAAKYVVKGYTPNTVERISAIGNGELLLDLSIPLPYSGDIKLAGSYQFHNNQIDLGLDVPYLEKIIVENIVNLEKVNGILTFTESNMNIEKIRAQILGGPVSINSTVPLGGGIRLTAVGKANLDNLRQLTQDRPAGDQIWTKYLRGSTDWRAVFQIHDNLTDVSIESSLQGITSDLPEPFSKMADDVVPLRFEKKVVDLRQDMLKISYGTLVAAQILRSRDDAGNYYVKRGILSLGTAPSMLPETGVLLIGSLPILKLDQWRNLFKRFNSFKKSDEENELHLGLTGINLHIGVLDFLGRRFNDVALDANMNSREWHSTILSREIDGKVSWYPHNQGKVVARLKRLIVPTVYPTEPNMAKQQQQGKNQPSLDVVVDKLTISDKQLGKLELIASQQDQNWRIEKLYISNHDSSLVADGIWRNLSASPRIQMNIKLETSDIDMFLTRLGYPDRVKRGSGKLEGVLSWLGGPQSIDYPTLSGEIKVQAKNGQFPEFDLGISKLFGIFDLQALPRRVKLDFRDVFGDGFGFDKLSGSASITRGTAFTDDLKIGGPAADVEIKGKTNLSAETYKLHVTVIPSLGLVTPVVDIATIIVNKSLEDPIMSNKYNITGTWTEPIITKLH